MKLFKLTTAVLFLFSLTSILSSCGGEDCTPVDWVGIYSGTEVCDGDSSPVTITVATSGTDAVSISYVYTDGSGSVEFDPIDTDDCSLSSSNSEDGLSLDIDASIDGDEFSLESEFSFDGETSTCVVSGTRM